MNNLKDILDRHHLHPKSYQLKNKSVIINTNTGKYVIKVNTNNYDIYNYLHSRGFNYFPNNYSVKDERYDIASYVENISISKTQRIEDLILVLSILHYKTSYKKEIDLDEIKDLYETNKNNIEDLLNYYSKLNDYLDTIIFLSPGQYLLIRNISLIYFMLNYSLKKLNKWYVNLKDNKTIRVSLIHNNVDIEHILINDNKYLISWDKSKIDSPIIDLVSVYKKYYQELKLLDLINIYENNNVLEDYEKDLLFIKLSIPKKIEFTSNNLEDVISINNEIYYLKKVHEYIKNDQETFVS